MKRYTCLLTIVAAILLFCGCSTSNDDQVSKSVNFYYCNESISFNSANGVISSEVRKAEGFTDSIEPLLALYFKGPITPGFVSPFPSNLQVEAVTQSSNRIHITLSSEFSELTGMDMTLACACLAKTVQELSDADYLLISYDNTVTGKHQTIVAGPDSFLMVDDSANAENTEE